MDYEALKDQWSEVEERDGVRLSWNVFPSTRMVRSQLLDRQITSDRHAGGFTARCTYRRALHSSERKARHSAATVRACHL